MWMFLDHDIFFLPRGHLGSKEMLGTNMCAI